MKIIKYGSKELEKIYQRSLYRRPKVISRVGKIIEEVRLYGDEAVIRYTKKYDRVKLTAKQLRVSQAELSGAYQNIEPDFVANLKIIIDNVTKFYKRQSKKSWRIKDREGVVIGEQFGPLESAGIYIPAGTAPLVSTVYMTVLPAKIAGVKRIVLLSPPDKSGNINPHILVVADLLKVDEIYKVGGAQAIAACAFGTKTIPKVQKIVGPGNIYVTEAKRQLYGYADIDMLAGPTELVIIANRYSHNSYIKADLLAQGEHRGGLAILITTSKAQAKQFRQELASGYIVPVKNLKAAVEVANAIAPEHLEILIKNPFKIVRQIKNAGAVFLGHYSPAAVGDYVAGPSHVLPTSGTAKFFSGLSLSDFIKSSHIISYSKKALESVRGPLEKIANIEGLTKHLDSVKARFS
ncbi:MAG: histidinol dehydrogenase [Omnitrophica WOR_2 bacterium RIFCSPHIGHO2_02_FULL_45_21]|nr:MAG: histidinol dehydrogenase [Omnitrophica WOR_2 bacterium RIFCSPHIGHO2_02_FULL_45_21]